MAEGELNVSPRLFKIKPGVKPYGGNVLEAKSVSSTSVQGFVRLGRNRYATAQRTYLIHEVHEMTPKTTPAPSP
jgi:hypothetical protein